MRTNAMLKLVCTVGLIASTSSFAEMETPAEPSTYHLQMSCKAQLLSNQDKFKLHAESPAFLPTIDGFGNSAAKLTFGPFTLIASMMQARPYGSSSIEPTFEMMLFKDGNPVQGNVQSSALQGLDLPRRAFNAPLSLYAARFLQFTYEGKNVSRIDYSCSVTKIQ